MSLSGGAGRVLIDLLDGLNCRYVDNLVPEGLARIARELRVPKMMLIVNKTPPSLEPAAVKLKVEKAYGCDVAAVLPHSNEMMELASGGIFVARHPNHPLTALYKQIAAQVTA